jgi:hypothetical protein
MDLRKTRERGSKMTPRSEKELVTVASALIGLDADLTSPERKLLRDASCSSAQADVTGIAALISAGGDPLGEAFCTIRDTSERRSVGATYTPPQIVNSMIRWATRVGQPSRVVDPGAGSGRFLLAAAHRFPRAELVAVETDPLAALMLRANAVTLGVSDRLTVAVDDYRAVKLPEAKGPTLFIGNPPYVRHHQISPIWKSWFASAAATRGLKASKLAGLHVHFFLKTMELARKGDFGAFITSAEWLDVNYGALLRRLLSDGLGACALHVLDPKAMPFADAATTGVITCFRVGQRPEQLRVHMLKSIDELEGLSNGKLVPWDKVKNLARWSTIVRPTPKPPKGYIELGELCRVHRGQVTGGNSVWIAHKWASHLPPDVLLPTITKARELFEAGERLTDATHLQKVIDLPGDLGDIPPEYRECVKAFLHWARNRCAHQSYIARNRRPWWSVRLRDPAPIICTYMARRPPNFVRNLCGARHLNIAHGLYPREPMDEAALEALSAYLRKNVSVRFGRTYAGGLTKFEPRELERIPIPALHNLGCTTHMHGLLRT